MRSHLWRATALASAAFLVANGCSETRTDLATGIEQPQFKPAKPTNTVPIELEFRDSTENGTLVDGLLSDGGGPYLGIFRENGSLIFSTTDESQNASRQIYFNSGDQADAPDGFVDALLTTSYPQIEGNPPGGMLTMEWDPPATLHTGGQFIWSSWELKDGKETPAEWYLRYGSSCVTDYSDSTLIENRFDVIRLSETQWTFEGDSAVLCRRWVRGRFVLEEMGRFAMPFKLDIVKMP